MNDIIYLGLLSLIVIRILALMASIDFYFVTKNERIAWFSIGWVFQILAGFCPIIAAMLTQIEYSQFFLFLNSIFISIGSSVVITTMLEYFIKIRKRVIVIVIIILTTISTFLYIGFEDPSVSIRFSSTFINGFSILYALVPLFKLKTFKNTIGNSARWYFVFLILLLGFIPIILIIYLRGYNFGLYNSDDPALTIFNYAYSILISTVQLVFIVHIEFNQRYNINATLKDKYSHELGNILQILYTSIQLVKKKEITAEEINELLDLSEEKCVSASEFLKNIKKYDI
ncbi:MAG: hypothetical protein JW891_12210 [Candidatus Lokiarchaeota archaeon]|nr:hypothetical protein [Candidatus Lokiarchaeota archaeon]